MHFGKRDFGIKECPVCRGPVLEIQKAFVS
jgi:hypothetical protein